MSARLGLAILVLVAAPAAAQTIYSDAQLLEQGNRAYQQADCALASRFLFAYQQRNPPTLQDDAALRTNLATALSACIARLARLASGAGVEGKVDDPKAAGAAPPPPLPKLVLAAAGAAVLDGRCDIYASIAVAQERANRKQSCALQGPMWSDAYRYHYDWCIGAPEADRRAGTAARQSSLDRCRP